MARGVQPDFPQNIYFIIEHTIREQEEAQMAREQTKYIILIAALSVLCAAWLYYSWMHGFLPNNFYLY